MLKSLQKESDIDIYIETANIKLKNELEKNKLKIKH